MRDSTPDSRFTPRDETPASTPPADPLRRVHEPDTHDFAVFADLTTQMETPEAPDETLDPPPTGNSPVVLAEALIVSGALDAHIERIVRHVFAGYDAEQNILSRRAGGYRPGGFGSIG